MIHNSGFSVNQLKKAVKAGIGKGVIKSCHGIIKVAETMAAVLGDKAAAEVAHGGKVAVVVNLHRILMRLFVRGGTRGGG